jgi:glycosyltransferase involved in cell wall biosynthesis
MRNIAFISGYRLDLGGVETYLTSFPRIADPEKYRWYMITPASEDFIGRFRSLGGFSYEWQPGFPLDIPAGMTIHRLLQEYQFDLVHVQDLRAAMTASLPAKLHRVPVIRTVHMPEYGLTGEGRRSRTRQRYYKILERTLSRTLIDWTIYVSRSVHAQARAQGIIPATRSGVIPNGIDLTTFTRDNLSREKLRSRHRVQDREMLVTFTGRLERQKGLDVLLQAVAQTPAHDALVVWVIGDGPELQALRELSARLNIDQIVRFIPWSSDIPSLLASSDLYILPSRYEGMPFGLLEAMASGLPCIVTDVGDCGELVSESGCGFVVPPEDVDQLASALERALANPESLAEMGAAGRAWSRQYTEELMVNRTLAIYQEALRLQES